MDKIVNSDILIYFIITSEPKNIFQHEEPS